MQPSQWNIKKCCAVMLLKILSNTCRFLWCFASLFIVGVGSWLFHMTLRYDMQLLDEVPMVWGGCILSYCMYQVKAPLHKENKPLAFILGFISVAFPLAHMYFKLAIIHYVRYTSTLY
jgi:dihydroceramidase